MLSSLNSEGRAVQVSERYIYCGTVARTETTDRRFGPELAAYQAVALAGKLLRLGSGSSTNWLDRVSPALREAGRGMVASVLQ